MRKWSGFTLIELLVVIAVLGVLAGGVLVAINPLEKIAKAKDSTKKTTVSQLVNALQSYYTLSGGKYPQAGSAWIDTLVSNGDLKNVPPQAGGVACAPASSNHNGYCYKTNTPYNTEAIVYAGLESSERPSGTSGTTPYIMWSSATGESGIYYSIASDVPDAIVTSGFTSGPISTLTQGLAGWWKMNGNADDSSGNGNNGTVTGATLTTDRKGQTNKAYNFPNSGSNVITITDTSLLDFGTSPFSVSFWFKSTKGTGSHEVPISKKLHTGNVAGWLFWFATSDEFRFLTSNSVGDTSMATTAGAQWRDSNWHHVVGVREGNGTLRLFVDNVEVAINEGATLRDVNNAIDLRIGRTGEDSTLLKGDMDDVRIYNRVLSADEVSNLFSAGPQ